MADNRIRGVMVYEGDGAVTGSHYSSTLLSAESVGWVRLSTHEIHQQIFSTIILSSGLSYGVCWSGYHGNMDGKIKDITTCMATCTLNRYRCGGGGVGSRDAWKRGGKRKR